MYRIYWPCTTSAVAGTAVTTRTTQKKLAAVASKRETFEDLGPRASHALKVASEAIKRANDGLASRVKTQRKILNQVEVNCVDLQRLLPAAGGNAVHMVLAMKACALPCGLTLILHGVRPLVWADRTVRTAAEAST